MTLFYNQDYCKHFQMLIDKTLTLLNWISEVCSLYISPFFYEHIVNIQHGGKKLQTKLQHIVRGFMSKLLNKPELKYAWIILEMKKSNNDHPLRINKIITNLLYIISIIKN